jgi:hypothetical protein
MMRLKTICLAGTCFGIRQSLDSPRVPSIGLRREKGTGRPSGVGLDHGDFHAALENTDTRTDWRWRNLRSDYQSSGAELFSPEPKPRGDQNCAHELRERA